MTTKQSRLFNKQQKPSLINQTRTENGINFLNQNQKCPDDVLLFQSFSKLKNVKQYDGSVTDNNNHCNRKSWNQSTKDYCLKVSKNPSLNCKEEKEVSKRWKNNYSSTSTKINTSTLSLHISAYENSFEVVSSEIGDLPKPLKASKFADYSVSSLQDHLEFPRQMEESNESPSKPEIQQFKTSQKLFSPNQSISSSSRHLLHSPMNGKKWRKILYEDQGYPDNYYETSEFLKGLKTNVNVVHYSLLQAIAGSSYLISQINVVSLFLILFELVQMEIVEFELLFSITIAAAFFCFLCYVRLNFSNLFTKDRLFDDFQSLITMICLGYGFTPIIRTLTTTISTDTIYTMTFCLFIFSLVFHDYGMDAPIVSRAYSLNLSLAASICLISRLKDNPTAFCFLALALCCFGFWPNFRNQIASDFPRATPLLQSFILIPASIFCTTFISIPLTILNCLIQFFILFVCPFILVKMQHLKSTIHGPWDEATIGDLKKDD